MVKIIGMRYNYQCNQIVQKQCFHNPIKIKKTMDISIILTALSFLIDCTYDLFRYSLFLYSKFSRRLEDSINIPFNVSASSSLIAFLIISN